MNKSVAWALLAAPLALASCKKEDDTPQEGTFTVTVENTFTPKEFFASGSTDLITPGNSAEISFDAGPGHYLQLATMYVASNDLFFAPQDAGLALYDMNGNPLTGDVSDQFLLWDAGTEVNEEPGNGPNQPMNQAGPNTGADENGVVQLVSAIGDGFTYPTASDVFSAELTHDGGTRFTLILTNHSDMSSLPSPLAPGVWVIHGEGQYPVFETGSAAQNGLEGLAEDGTNAPTAEYLEMNAGYVSPFAPGACSVGSKNTVFTTGAMASSALEGLAEDGNVSGFTSVFALPNGASMNGPILPDGSYSFTFSAAEGDRLSLATMLVQSNDWFIGLNNLDLFPNGEAISGDVTAQAGLYDAGTEVDMYAGAGADQPLRQAGPNTGDDENGVVEMEVMPGGHVPGVEGMVKISVVRN